MKRNATFLSLPALALLVASGAQADTNNTTNTAKNGDAEATAKAEATEVALADAEAQEATEGTGSGDADASGPVSEGEADVGNASAEPGDAAPDEADVSKDNKKEKAKDDKSAGAVSETLEPAKKPADSKEEAEEKEEEAAVPASLSAGGVVGGGSSFPLGMTVSLSNSLASGTFVPGAGNNPSLNTAVSLRPSFRVPNFLGEWQPNMLLTGSLTAQMEWFSSFSGASVFGPRDRQIRISDGAGSLILPGLISEPWTGASITPIFTVRAPLSVASRYNKRIIGGSATGMFSWNTAKLFGATFGLGGVRAVSSGTYWEHSGTDRTQPCGQSFPTGGTLFSGVGLQDGTTQAPLTVGRVDEVTDNGECILIGRQIVGSLSNSFSAFYSAPSFYGNHNISAGATTIHAFMRPVNNTPEIRSEFAQPQSFVNAVVFVNYSASYTYAVPSEWMPFNTSLQVTGGVNTFQPMFDGQGFVRPPIDLFFWSQRETGDAPAGVNLQASNNFTTGFLSLTMGI